MCTGAVSIDIVSATATAIGAAVRGMGNAAGAVLRVVRNKILLKMAKRRYDIEATGVGIGHGRQ